MTEIWQALVDVLEEMPGLYRQLLELSEEKRTLLIQAKPGELEAINRLEEALVIKGSEMENRRAKATAVILTSLGLSQDRATLNDLIALAEPDAAERLGSASRDIGAVLRELGRVNTVNAKLTEQALAFVNYNLNLLTRNQAESTYAPAGTAAVQRSTAALLDRKV